jgi:hypothetical protein
MRLSIGTTCILLALTAAPLAPALADPASEAFLKNQLATLDADADWSAAADAIRSEGEDTVLEGLDITATSPKAALTVGEMHLQNLEPGDHDSFSMSGGRLSDLRLVSPSLALVVPDTKPGQPDETVSIGSAEIGGIQGVDPRGFAELSKLDPHAEKPLRDEAMRKALDAMPEIKHVAINDMTLGNNDPLTMKSLSVDVDGYLGPIPLPWRAEMQDLKLPGRYLRALLKHVDPRVSQLIKIIDNDIFTVDASGGEEWEDEANGQVRAHVHAVINNGATIDISYSYVGVTETWLASVAGEALLGDLGKAIDGFQSGVQLKDMTIRISDKTVLDQIFGSVADQLKLGIDGATYRKQIASLALPLFMLAMGQPQLLDTFLQPVQQFLGEGKPLVVQLQPSQPASAEVIANTLQRDPAQLMTLLNLTMRNE